MLASSILPLAALLAVACAGPAATPAPRISAPPPAAATEPSPSPGTRLESSLGLQIEVPAEWATNDYGCNMSDRPTVVRGVGAQNACLTPEKSTKELAWIGVDGELPLELDTEVERRTSTLQGVPAERVEGRVSDGRFVGWLRVPTRKLGLLVKARDAALGARILDSAKLVGVDHNGCAERRPTAARPTPAHPSSAASLVPARPGSIAVCYYGAHGDRLQSSVRFTSAAALDLAKRLNASADGPNPDTSPKECLHPKEPPPADAVLVADDERGKALVYVAFSGCIGRGLDNGARRAQVSVALLHALLAPLHTGYGFNGPLPP